MWTAPFMQNLRTQRLTVRIATSIIEDSRQTRKQNRRFYAKNYFRKICMIFCRNLSFQIYILYGTMQ